MQMRPKIPLKLNALTIFQLSFRARSQPEGAKGRMFEVYSATIGLMERITWHCAPPLANVPQTTIFSCEMNSLINLFGLQPRHHPRQFLTPDSRMTIFLGVPVVLFDCSFSIVLLNPPSRSFSIAFLSDRSRLSLRWQIF
jgi:hypothetical protein